MKRYLSLLLVLLLCLAVVPVVSAAGNPVTDQADLLNPMEEVELRKKLTDLTQEYQVQIAVVTVNSTGSYSPDDFVEHLYDSQNYGLGANRDGVLLVVDMESRTYRILSNGMAADAISSGAISSIGDAIAPDLSDGAYADAFDTFADECVYYLDGYINGFPFDTGKQLLIALAIGLVAALIVTSVLKGQLKSVRSQYAAGDYVKPGSLQVTQATDFFLYRNVSKRAKPKNNSSGSSSGGGRNVGGGRF